VGEKTYLINEIFYSIQGEATWAGAPSVFVRFSKCNLACPWCDTDFKNGEPMTGQQILDRVDELVGKTATKCNLVFTGGEPSLQLDEALVSLAAIRGYFTCIETNGTRNVDGLGLDWITLSPKEPFKLEQHLANEVKLVSCYIDHIPELEKQIQCNNWFLQPLADGTQWIGSEIQRCIAWVQENPSWRLSLQLHKALGLR